MTLQTCVACQGLTVRTFKGRCVVCVRAWLNTMHIDDLRDLLDVAFGAPGRPA